MQRKTIDLYTFTYNDEDMLPFFLDYYKFVDRMTFIDSGSTDKTIKILTEFATCNNPEIRITHTGYSWWNDKELHEYRNFIWRDSKFDLIFFPDCDEIFYHPKLINYLNDTCFDVYEMDGFEMVSRDFPKSGTKITDIKTGFYHHMYNKSTIFRPIKQMSFLNAHVRFSDTANVNMGGIYLLHYRSLGIQMMMKRRDRFQKRTPKNYLQLMTDEQIRRAHREYLQQAKVII